jgi:hypothetical protein
MKVGGQQVLLGSHPARLSQSLVVLAKGRVEGKD